LTIADTDTPCFTLKVQTALITMNRIFGVPIDGLVSNIDLPGLVPAEPFFNLFPAKRSTGLIIISHVGFRVCRRKNVLHDSLLGSQDM
jgi:hypothetical protein